MRIILEELKNIGYTVKWKELWSKDYGTPQNRPRVWFACFRDEADADEFMFPDKESLKITVKSLLEEQVKEKYWIQKEKMDKIKNYTFAQVESRIYNINGLKHINTLLTSTDGEYITFDEINYRHFTPRECFRFMGFFNDEIKFGTLTDAKLYFMAGNGWDINIASKILKQMLLGNSNEQQFLSRWDKC